MQYGFVYVMRSDAMPNMYKIGMTNRSPAQRARELSKGTGIACDFEVCYYAEVESPAVIEKELHDLFDEYRFNDRREFFKRPLLEIVKAIRGSSEGILSENIGAESYTEVMMPGVIFPEAPLWFESDYHSESYRNMFKRYVNGKCGMPHKVY